MGANNSVIDTEVPLFSEKFPNITIRPLNPHTTTAQPDRESNKTAGTSHGHNQVRTTSVTRDGISSKAHPQPRRLPPVESRETVKSQAFQLTRWRIVDETDELYESCEIGNSESPAVSRNSLTISSNSDFDIKPSLAEIDEALARYQAHPLSNPEKAGSLLSPIILDASPAKLRQSSLDKHSLKSSPANPKQSPLNKRSLNPSPEPKRKRRLIPTKRAVEIANQKFERFGGMRDYLQNQPTAPRARPSTYSQEEFGFVNPFPDGFPLSDEEGHLRPEAHPGSCLYQDSDDEDEGYWSKVVSPVDSAETPEEEQARLKELLSRFHKRKQTGAKSSAKIKTEVDEGLLKLAREYMHRYEEAGAERSRQLREKALRRRGLLPTLENSALEGDSSSDHGKTLSDTGVDNGSNRERDSSLEHIKTLSHAGAENGFNSGLFCDDDCQAQSVEDVLDIAQEHDMENRKPIQSEVRDNLKTDRHTPCKGPTTQNPASRAAAERFRTQSRHLSDHHEPQTHDNESAASFNSRDSHILSSSSEGLCLRAKEERLREAKKPGVSPLMAKGVSNPPSNDQCITDDEINPRARSNRPQVANDRARALKLETEQQESQVSASAGNETNCNPSIRKPSGREMMGQERNAVIEQKRAVVTEQKRDAVIEQERNVVMEKNRDAVVEQKRNDVEQKRDTVIEQKEEMIFPGRRLSGLETLVAKRGAASEQSLDVKPVDRPLSGLEMLAAKQGAVSQQKPDPEPVARPLSGLEMLAAKQGAGREQKVDSKPVARPLSGLQTLNSRGTESQPRQENGVRPSTSITPGPNKGLTLPKSFDQLSEEEKDVIVQHEIAKERKRDLDALGSVFWVFAQLRCFPDREITERTMQRETNELYDIGKFIAIVIEQGKPGKMRRVRVQDIRENIRRRIQKTLADGSEEPDDVTIMTEMRRTFSQKHIDFINDETPKVQAEIDHWGYLRSEYSSKRHNSRPREHRKKERPKERTDEKSSKKQVRFAAEEKRTTQNKRPKGQGKTVEKRQTQADRQEQLIEKLRAQLKRFETADAEDLAELQSQVAEIEAELEREKQEDDESEEDDGAEFVFGAGQETVPAPAKSPSQTTQEPTTDEEQELQEINRLEDARQRESADTPGAGQQRPDAELLKRMQLKKSLPNPSQSFDPELLRQMQFRREQQLEAATDSTIIDRAAVGESDSEAEAADEYASDDDDTDEDEDRQVHRYTVWGTFVGMEIYKDADHYYLMKTYDATKAEAKVREIISGIHQHVLKNGTVLDHLTVVTEWHHGLMEQHIAVGESATTIARAWVECDLVDLNRKAFRAAKRQGAVKQVTTFAVHWEKTITPVASGAEEEAENETTTADSDGIDDLFEEPAEDKANSTSQATAPVTTTIPQDEIQHFTTPILANRHAKAVYLTWHNTFLPGWQNEGYRQLESDSMEEYLETLGSWGLFFREESFERAEVDEGGGPGRRVEEKFKVWVKKIAVSGPGN
ncbi:uncharacterized protein Z520_07782 [Fonsecaea multimorphosa CBS 102226]|uniref:Uncharacterized protein n=1 Tax=Fonsecaea multimorphosa CBS 102226 TaxID=1442371 RepID=A0A0D2IHK3_9EURO|nr:uncharacterized protein Z520_07782 [Fonsecaea multimorphosa CBS 102226]KIX96516.1 hypothetical protein Z520_07782 [Fonsecaea multimorphosa CBS 102226]OAL28042.1 hypothetical protein AYO22_03069 [Fonsecaea multimorphosa]